MNRTITLLTKTLPLLLCLMTTRDCLALGQTQCVETTSSPGSFPICAANKPAAICADTNDFAGVLIAANNLRTDISRVTGRNPDIFKVGENPGANVILIGTVGKSEIIDRLVREKKIDVSQIAGKWESFFLQVVPNPLPGIENALVICGSDKRGTIYGIYDLSEQIGVSPWYFWADVPAKHHDQLIREGREICSRAAVGEVSRHFSQRRSAGFVELDSRKIRQRSRLLRRGELRPRFLHQPV